MTAGAATMQLLGRPRIHLEAQLESFVSDKRFRLLAFLAYHGDWVSRERLAYLFWPDAPTEAARSSLRQLLKRVKTMPWLEGLEPERDRVRWQVRTDVAAFRQALRAGDIPSALSLYHGPLLQGLDEGAEEDFLGWLELEREHLQNLWRDALLRRAAQLDAASQPGEAAALFHTLLEQNALDEEALRAYMTAAFKAGQGQRALYAYRAFARRLQLELGLEPTSATQQVARAIQEGSQTAPAQPPALASAVLLPPAASSFLGRDEEVRETVRLLRLQDCRLLTLVGPGGAGKSRMALQIAQELTRDYQGGTYYLSLEYVSTPEALVFSLSATLQLELQGPEEPLAQLSRWLHDKKTLLVFDNYEHLLPDVRVVVTLLRTCPKLKLLVTSRARLDVAEEWAHPLAGLPYPRETVTLEQAPTFAAVRLFVERAQRVRPGFRLTPDDLAHVVKICDLVGGLPLGLELAAVWVRMMPCAAIAEEIERNLDFLSSSSRNAPGRHRSLRATFDHSWRLLTPKEQGVLQTLATFQGAFSHEAATMVAGASVAVLGALSDKSLLRVDVDSRYHLHPVLHGYLREKLAERPEEQALARQRHGAYYLHLLEQQARALQGPDELEARALLQEKLENVRAAWDWAVEAGKVRELHRATKSLMLFFDLQAHYQEGIGMLQHAAAALDEANPKHCAALGLMQVAQACLYPWLGAYVEAAQLAQSGLRLLQGAEDSWGSMLGHNILGLLNFFAGDAPAAQHYWGEALLLARASGDAYATAELLSSLGLAAAWQAKHEEAGRYAEEALALLPGLGEQRSAVYCLLYLGLNHLFLAQAPAGRVLLQRGLELAQRIREGRYVPHLLYALGAVALDLGEASEAEAFCQEALAKAEENGDVLAQNWALTYLGRISLLGGDDARAQDYLERSLRLGLHTDNKLVLPLVVLLLCQRLVRLGYDRQALESLRPVMGSLLASALTETATERLLASLQDHVPADVLAEARSDTTANFDTAEVGSVAQRFLFEGDAKRKTGA